MAAYTSLLPLLAKLRDSLEATASGLPAAEALHPPENGISLLDTKTDLFLSYLQHLTFLILVKVRRLSSSSSNDGASLKNGHVSSKDGDEDLQNGETDGLDDEVVKKLAELRVYLERGVRPLESKLKYQIDKVVRAAESQTDTSKTANGQGKAKNTAEGEGPSEDEEEVDELSYRPNIAALMAPGDQTTRRPNGKEAGNEQEKTGLYRPPRINPTALPTTDADAREKQKRRAPRSAALDEYVSEMGTAPAAEPSIGSTIVAGGRRMKTTKERSDEEERRRYEESNFMRLPKESKKERKRKEDRAAGTFGGEDWRGLGEAGDRIQRMTSKKRRGDDFGMGGKKRKMGR